MGRFVRVDVRVLDDDLVAAGGRIAWQPVAQQPNDAALPIEEGVDVGAACDLEALESFGLADGVDDRLC